MNRFPGGSWPVMLTFFSDDNSVDYDGIRRLTDWYISNGVSGLFAVCQSSEMFFLSLEERVSIAKCIVEHTAGRVPVIASGHVSDDPEQQAAELAAMAKTGVDALILITNRLANEEDDDSVWIENCSRLLEKLPQDLPLGLYECPYPYKRLLTKETISWCADTGRFYFLKDTCCDEKMIEERIRLIEGSHLRLYNANTTTLLSSLQKGAAGYSGVMDNFHPNIYSWLCDNYSNAGVADKVREASDFLTTASLIERQWYPVNAKYYLQTYEKLNKSIHTRTKSAEMLTETFKEEVAALYRQTKIMEAHLNIR